MIGQTQILDMVDCWIANNSVPRFMIICGGRLCGKTYLAKEIAKRMKSYLIQCEQSVDSVREAVKNCYKCAGTTVYLFDNADNMSAAAKNALLKITEEPPRQAHFIVVVRNLENMLPTLRSRATVLQMAPYSKYELDEFYKTQPVKLSPLIREVCNVPGMMLEMENVNVEELVAFCNSIVDNIQQVTGVNALKITQRIRIKEDGPGYDPDLFFHTLQYVISKRIWDLHVNRDVDPFSAVSKLRTLARMLVTTNKYYNEFNLVGVKKDATLDMWILEMREC